jgi:hypothetical protein
LGREGEMEGGKKGGKRHPLKFRLLAGYTKMYIVIKAFLHIHF